MFDHVETEILAVRLGAFRQVWAGGLATLVLLYGAGYALLFIDWTMLFSSPLGIVVEFPLVFALVAGGVCLAIKGFFMRRLRSRGSVDARMMTSRVHVLLAASEYFSAMIMGLLFSAALAAAGFINYMFWGDYRSLMAFGFVSLLMLVVEYPKRSALEAMIIKEKRRMSGYPEV